jgi:hypothetical protein
MPHQEEIIESGHNFGMEGVEHVTGRAEAYCECERERLALVNEPRIQELNAYGSHLAQRETMLVERLRHAAPPGDVPRRLRKSRFYWIMGIALAVAAFCFSVIGLAPYRLGWTGYLYCLGVAVVTPFAVEEFLKVFRSERLGKIVATAVFLAAVVGGGVLAEIRGDLLARETEQSSASVRIEDGNPNPVPAPPEETFYKSTRDLLRIMMILFAFAIDLGAGVAIHHALALGEVTDEDPDMLLRQLGEVRQQLGAVVAEITALTNGPAVFVSRFWRDFYRAMLTQTSQKAITKRLRVLILLPVLWSARACAEDRWNLTAALDLSISEGVKSMNQKTPFERNVDGVARLLASVPSGSRVTVIGITSDSIRDPTPILRAELAADDGYFGERLAAGRAELERVWRARAARLAPSARGTDILGALQLVHELFSSEPGRGGRNVLVIFSDMRNATPTLNLETPHLEDVNSMLKKLERHAEIADLTGVTVYVVGANGGGKNIRDWQAIKEFWIAYFGRAGARCGGYSTLITLPTLAQ